MSFRAASANVVLAGPQADHSAGVGKANLVCGSGPIPSPAGESKLARQDGQGQDTMRRESLQRAKAANLIVE